MSEAIQSTDKKLFMEIFTVVGGAYASYQLSEDAWNYWLKLVSQHVEQQENAK